MDSFELFLKLSLSRIVFFGEYVGLSSLSSMNPFAGGPDLCTVAACTAGWCLC